MRIFLFIFSVIIFMAFSCSKKQAGVVMPENSTPEQLLKYGNELFQQGDYENAFIAYGIIYNNYPTSREYIDAVIGLSKCYGAMQDYNKQFELLYNLIRENIVPTRVPDIYNAIAEFYERSAGISEQLTGEGTADFQKAISYYQKAIEYPNSDDRNAKGYAQYKIGTLYEQMQNWNEAIKAYQNTINLFGESAWASLAEQRIAEIRLRLEKQAQYQSTVTPSIADTTQPAPPPTSTPASVADTTIKPPPPPLPPTPSDTVAAPDTSNIPQEAPQQAPPDTSTKPELDFK